MSEPTPGPWRVASMGYHHPHSGAKGVHYWITDGDERPIGMDSRTSESAEANARLLAAAPDLLAACESAREALRFNSSDVALVIMAAIVKAKEGGKP